MSQYRMILMWLSVFLLSAVGITVDAREFNNSGLGFGFCDAPGNPREVEIFQSIGAEYVRMEVGWSRIETVSGEWNFTRYDNLIETAAESGRKIILLLCYDHPRIHAEGDEKMRIEPENIPEFLEYVHVVINRWGHLIAGVEVWNEPNHWIFWEGTDDEFFLLTRETVAFIKESAPDLPVAVGSIMLNPWMGGRAYLKRFLDSGAMEGADALSIHPYGYWIPSQAKWVAQARKELDDRGYGDRALWITEIGYPTKSLFPYRVTLEELPYWIAKSLIRLTAAGADIITWYDLYTSYNAERTAKPFGDASFGLLYREPDGRYIPKNGFETYGRVANALGGYVYLPYTVYVKKPLDTVLRVYQYGRGETERVLCLWSKVGYKEIKLLGFGGRTMNTITGEERTLVSGDSIIIGEHPIIITFDIPARADAIFASGDGVVELTLGNH